VGLGVAQALREASGSGVVVVGGVAGSCDVGWVGRESEVVEDVADEVRIADVREDGAGTSAGSALNTAISLMFERRVVGQTLRGVVLLSW
jgi:hypothetical protein